MTASSPQGDFPKLITRAHDRVHRERDQLKTATETFMTNPRPGSLYLTDKNARTHAPHHTANHPYQQLRDHGLHLTHLTLANLIDHMWGTAQLLSGPELPLYSHQTTARVAVESAARIAYALDTTVTFEQRLLRMAAFCRADAKEHVDGARDMPTQMEQTMDAINQSQKQSDSVQKWIAKAKIIAARQRMTLGSESAPQKPLIVDLIEQHFNQFPGLYRMMSGVVHSSKSTLNSALSSASKDSMEFTPDVPSMAMAGVFCMAAAGVAGHAYATYCGYDGSDYRDANKTRVQSLDDLVVKEFAMRNPNIRTRFSTF
jgi:hypothetical protein